jgi:hypothetical protein
VAAGLSALVALSHALLIGSRNDAALNYDKIAVAIGSRHYQFIIVNKIESDFFSAHLLGGSPWHESL